MAEVSIVALIDGEGCEDESIMGYWGLFLWFFILIYCMMGQFVLCEEYFVPVLSNLGNRLGMSGIMILMYIYNIDILIYLYYFMCLKYIDNWLII